MIVGKVEKLRVEDIDEIIDSNVQGLGQYCLVKLKEESRDRFGGEEQVACALTQVDNKKQLSMQSAVLLNLRNRNLGKSNNVSALIFVEAEPTALSYLLNPKKREVEEAE